MKLKITQRKDKPFRDGDGNEIEYYWYKAVRLEDDVTINFGSKDGGHEEGELCDLTIEKYEGTDRKGNLVYRYREMTLL